MLIQRILLGSLMIAALVGLMVLDVWLSADMPNRPGLYPHLPAGAAAYLWGLPTVAVAALLAVLATLEFGSLLRGAGHQPAVSWAAIITAGLIVMPWVEQYRSLQCRPPARAAPPQTWTPPGSPASAPAAAPRLFSPLSDFTEDTLAMRRTYAQQLEVLRPVSLVWLMGGVVGTCLLVLARRKTAGAIAAMATTLLMIVFVGLLGSFLVRIRCLAPGPAGAVLVVYTVLAIKACDIGAYLLGRVFGRTLLAPWLSPAKTVEGFVAGLVLACLVATGGMIAWGAWGAARLGPPPLNMTQALVFGVFMAVLGHLGDLTESAFKRDLSVKDSGRVVPSFGGFLDILDSPLFAAPVAWWLLAVFGRWM